MYFPLIVLNFLALGALFSNHRLAAMAAFLAYTALNAFFLFQASPTKLDAIFFAVMSLSTLVVYVALSSTSRDQVLTRQKKRGSIMLLVWSLLLAFFFGHWLLALSSGVRVEAAKVATLDPLKNGETFMLLVVIILWMVGKNLYDRR